MSPCIMPMPMIQTHEPALLLPVSRQAARKEIGIDGKLPFSGADLWSAYEISWLDRGRKPRIAIGSFTFPATTPSLIESKSLKLYLNSLNQEAFDDADAVRDAIARDLSAAAGGVVDVRFILPSGFSDVAVRALEGASIDDLDVVIQPGLPDGALLAVGSEVADETFVTDLLRSCCPLTGQPDWASLSVRYRGPRIERESLLRYVVSFRLHRDFHEHCVERIFMDVLTRCRPSQLTVQACYTRRGGIDISPFRTNCGDSPARNRTPRQ